VVCVASGLNVFGWGAGCAVCSGGARAVVGLQHDVGGFNPVGRHRDRSAVYGDAHSFLRAGQDLVVAAVGRVQGAPYCILPEEDTGSLPDPCGQTQPWTRRRCASIFPKSGAPKEIPIPEPYLTFFGVPSKEALPRGPQH
jgi:hypothetical protein